MKPKNNMMHQDIYSIAYVKKTEKNEDILSIFSVIFSIGSLVLTHMMIIWLLLEVVTTQTRHHDFLYQGVELTLSCLD